MAILADPARTAERTIPAFTGTAAKLALDPLCRFTAARGRNAKLCALLLVALSVSVSNVALQTAVPTHGRLPLLLVVLRIRKPQEVRHSAEKAPQRSTLQLRPPPVRRSDLRKTVPVACR